MMNLEELQSKYRNLLIQNNDDRQEVRVSYNDNLVYVEKYGTVNEELISKINNAVASIQSLTDYLNSYMMFEIVLDVIDEDVSFRVHNVYSEKEYMTKNMDLSFLQDIVSEYFDHVKQNVVKEFNEQNPDMQVKNLSILTQNSKMKDSTNQDVVIYNFGIPAFKSASGLPTCPNATNCVSGCYARQGTYIWKNTQAAYERRLMIVQHSLFKDIIKFEVEKLVSKNEGAIVMIRIHDSGDFYSEEYQKMWYMIAEELNHIPNLIFYAYTKMISQSKNLQSIMPGNFDLIFSYGGSEDGLINREEDRHSQVFESEEDLIKNGYVNASDDDKNALDNNHKVGLVYHGAKGFGKTRWDKVQK